MSKTSSHWTRQEYKKLNSFDLKKKKKEIEFIRKNKYEKANRHKRQMTELANPTLSLSGLIMEIFYSHVSS